MRSAAAVLLRLGFKHLRLFLLFCRRSAVSRESAKKLSGRTSQRGSALALLRPTKRGGEPEKERDLDRQAYFLHDGQHDKPHFYIFSPLVLCVCPLQELLPSWFLFWNK